MIMIMSGKKKNSIFVGTSGYSYKDWLGNFYPQFCPEADYLRFYSSIFNTVEINATYYRMPTGDMVKKWKKQTPDDFLFTAKFPSSVTHDGDIKSRINNAGAFIDIIQNLEEKLGPLLMQFPYSFRPDENYDDMEKLVKSLQGNIKVALEVRNRKWLEPKFYDLLRSKNIALVMIDHPWMPRKTEFTSNFAYIRFLGDRKKIPSDFSFIRMDREKELNWWSELIEEFSRDEGEVYAYVNNHYSGHSPSTARRLKELLGISD